MTKAVVRTTSIRLFVKGHSDVNRQPQSRTYMPPPLIGGALIDAFV